MESNGATSRVVVVTGASMGIGRAIATTLAALGWTVVGIARDRALLEKAVGEIGGVAVAGDVRDLDVLRTARRAAEERGELRAWVNNAAVVRLAPLHLMGPDVVTELLDINLTAVVLGTREALCSFLANRVAGSIINVSSIHGQRAFPGYGAYDTAKGGMEALTRYVCTEYGHLGIRCNAIAPGPVRTDIVAPVAADEPKPASFAAKAEDLSPMHRISEPAEIAETVAFLISDRTVSINGHVLAVDNGMSAWAFGFPPDESVAFAAEQ
jgi:glucose 1-dehydrogenase